MCLTAQIMFYTKLRGVEQNSHQSLYVGQRADVAFYKRDKAEQIYVLRASSGVFVCLQLVLKHYSFFIHHKIKQKNFFIQIFQQKKRRQASYITIGIKSIFGLFLPFFGETAHPTKNEHWKMF